VTRDLFVPYLSSNIPLNLYSYFHSQEHITRSLINCIPEQVDYMALTVKCTMQAYSIRHNQEYHDSENSQCKLESGARLCLWYCADFFWMGHRDHSEGIILAVSLHGFQCLYSKHDFEMIYWQSCHIMSIVSWTIAPRIRYLSRTETRMEDMNHLSINHPVCRCYSPLYRHLPMDTVQMGRDTVTFVGFFFCFLFWSLDNFLNIC